MFYQYCHAACRKYIFPWQRQVAVLPTALNTRTKNTELLTHMNSPHMHLLEKFPSYFPQQMKKNPHWTYPFILLNKQQSKKPCQCTSLPHFSFTAVLFLCCQGYLILTLLPFFVACFEGVLLLLFLYFYYLASFCMHHTGFPHTHTLLHRTSDVLCPDSALHQRHNTHSSITFFR